jgi:hypothetical protein
LSSKHGMPKKQPPLFSLRAILLGLGVEVVHLRQCSGGVYHGGEVKMTVEVVPIY